MRIEFITNASVLIHCAGGCTILCDPWFSRGVFYGSWYNFPPLSERQLNTYHNLHPDYIFISHSHPDHLDPKTLAHYDTGIPVLIGKRAHNHLFRTLSELGFADIRELPVGEFARLDGIEVAILPQFSGSADGHPDDVSYDLDSSLWIKDDDGTQLLHLVDNPTKPDDALQLVERYGRPDVALVPYAGASFFPHAFNSYSESEKHAAKDTVKDRRLEAFCEIANILKPQKVIPAAGSYVMGGRIANYSQFLHQGTPGDLAAVWEAKGNPSTQLCVLSTGDVLDASTGDIAPGDDNGYRHFTEGERTAYALTLKDNVLPQDDVHIPQDFALPWQRLLAKARRNQWFMQQRLNMYPEIDVAIELQGSMGVGLGTNENLVFRYSLDSPELRLVESEESRAVIRFRIDASILLMVLLSAAIWNNVEIAALVECERTPDRHDPTVHSLMSFFTL
jgi:UDP-MurNAc hydroxylase